MKKKRRSDFLSACLFLGPNLLGFLTFVAFPVIFSVTMAFTNWDITLHNDQRNEPLNWIWFRNFYDLFNHPDFWKYFGNTLFLMMGIPIGIAGSLLLAVLLTRRLRSDRKSIRWALTVLSVVGFTGLGLFLWVLGYGLIAFIFCLLAGVVLALGFTTGATVYRTLFYLPHFTSGVAVFILWKHLYNPRLGPINLSLKPVLKSATQVVRDPSSFLITLLHLSLVAIVLAFGLRRLRRLAGLGGRKILAAAVGVIAVLPAVVALTHTFPPLANLIAAWGSAAGVNLAWIAAVHSWTGWVFWSVLFAGILVHHLWKLPDRDVSHEEKTSGPGIFLAYAGILFAVQAGILASMAVCLHRQIVEFPSSFFRNGQWVSLGLMVLVFTLGLRRIRRMWTDGEMGRPVGVTAFIVLLLPGLMAMLWVSNESLQSVLALGPAFNWISRVPVRDVILGFGVIAVVWQLSRLFREERIPCASGEGLGTALMFAAAIMVVQFILVGIGIVFYGLPGMAAATEGLTPPNWLGAFHWAKPALMMMGLWGALGSNNMLLYIAGISNVPQELYEAADVDGASRWQRFWHITWPQLAPTTFFIVIMSFIGGIQGGFNQARTMTKGGPFGATTTLAYYVYVEGFETGRFGYASAVAWTMFVMVFVVTIFNYKFGSRYVNE